MKKVSAILEKEWHEAIKNRIVLLTGILLPALFVILPLGLLYGTRNVPVGDADMDELPPTVLSNPMFAGLEETELLQAFLINQFMALFMVTPLAIPMTIATYSIVGEKRERSLEPLLATPITTFELLFGKALAAALPGVVVAWLSYALYAVAARWFVASDNVYRLIFHPAWLVAMLVIAPLLTVLAVSVGLIVSSRVNDPRAAEQIGMVVILPVMAVVIGQMAGVVQIGVPLMIGAAVMLAVVDVILIAVGSKLFQRETILTRWR